MTHAATMTSDSVLEISMLPFDMPSFSVNYTFAPATNGGAFDFVQTTLGVLLGFLLAIGWELFQESRRNYRNAFGASDTVHIELLENRQRLQSNLTILAADTEAAEKDREVVEPLKRISTVAGEAAGINGAFSTVLVRGPPALAAHIPSERGDKYSNRISRKLSPKQ